jgi:O-acetyl-ADP-ribose deacetylase (regulator of RNase III)
MSAENKSGGVGGRMEKMMGNTTVRVAKEDVTMIDVSAFIFYASHDLKLGTGFGGAVSVRGGPTIQKELDEIGKLETTQSVATAAGELNADFIIHSVGPRFQEQETERKLRQTMRSALKVAEEKGAETLAFPPMGCGFYGVPMDLSARVMFDELKNHLEGQTKLKEVTVCVIDNREYKPFADRLAAMA